MFHLWLSKEQNQVISLEKKSWLFMVNHRTSLSPEMLCLRNKSSYKKGEKKPATVKMKIHLFFKKVPC